MYLHVDPTQVPPAVEVREPDDFTAFKVVIEVPEHAWIAPDGLTELAGRGDDDEWRQNLAGMLAYAAGKGWCDEAGRVRAHVEVTSAAPHRG
ncbi:hypothetical protein [Mycolicibacterium mucogenicum]|uniref:Uncharacterized protein n=1 Tax=Mycolicibacterium mucogenicum DSM 44124 TaxID=1226753 RepID=A0A8H2JD51_MYCMU|nr:hypothetical protein [Mycolicibacterium mucogenicum]KAB7756373.1 hypothetical protein MMUC44124_16815 [Mycolicibacterium mucogenicum DSM 44124]QPG67100.1 hypothetical protein C1S78_016005 [Mycolicibacterium mucogenicum DSM 44124]